MILNIDAPDMLLLCKNVADAYRMYTLPEYRVIRKGKHYVINDTFFQKLEIIQYT